MVIYKGQIPETPRLQERSGQAVGWSGIDIYNDSSAHTGNWKSFVVIKTAVISAITDNGASASTVPTATELPPGTFVSANGLFTSIQLTSGMVEMVRD